MVERWWYDRASFGLHHSTQPGAAAHSGNGSPVDPSWVHMPAGIKVVANLKALAQAIVALPDDQVRGAG